MAPPNVNYWKTDPKYIELLSYLIKRAENVESPISVRQLVRDFHQKSGDAQTVTCLRHRFFKIRTIIHSIGHIDTKTKVKVLFALSAPVDAGFLKELRKDAFVEVDERKRITHYKANDKRLELNGYHSLSEKHLLINKYFKNKNDGDVVPKNKEDKEVWNLIQFITEKCENVNFRLNITQLTKDFNKLSGSSRSFDWIRARIREYCHEIQKAEFLETSSKVKQLFGLSATLSSSFLEKLRKDAVVEVDDLNRITKYTANDGGLTLHGDHSQSAKLRTAQFASKRSHRSMIDAYFKNKNDVDAVPMNEKEKEMGNFIEFIAEKCDTADRPLRITHLVKDFNNNFGISRSLDCIQKRVKGYCREIQKTEFLDTTSKVKHLFSLSGTLNSDFLETLRKDASVEVDNSNRITKFTAKNGLLKLCGEHSRSTKAKLAGNEGRKRKNTFKKHSNSGDDDSNEYSSEEFGSEFDSDEEDDHLNETEDRVEPSAVDFDEDTPVRNYSSMEMSIDDYFDFDPPTERSHRSEEIEMREEEENYPKINPIINKRYKRSKQRYSDSEDDSDSHPEESDDENSHLNETKDPMEPSNETDDFDNKTPVGNRSPTGMSFDNNFDFDLPSERSYAPEETEMREDDEKDDPENTDNAAAKTQRSGTLPNSKNSSSTSHTPKTPKRKADASAGSSSTKRIKAPSDKSMNPGEINDNCSHDDPSSVELKPFRGILGLPKEAQKDSDIQQIPKPRPQVMEAPIKKEYEEEAYTSLKMVLNAFNSLIRSLDTPGLKQLKMELDKKIMDAGRRIEISNKEVILAMELLIVKLANYGAPKSSEDSISLREILSMLRTIILTLNFNGFEMILEMLKVNLEQLKVQDKKIPVSKAECVLRAILDVICT
ncbi:unnamed protein product [Caenorhabditis brenneri]